MLDGKRVVSRMQTGLLIATTCVAACSNGSNDDTTNAQNPPPMMCPPMNCPPMNCPPMNCPPAMEGDAVMMDAAKMIEEGRETFRFDTFGDEAFWGGMLRLHEAIAGEANGGIGAGVNPTMALQVGLKVDAEALPAALVDQIEAGQVDLNDPATTIELLRLNAVLGVKGFFSETPGPAANEGRLTSIGIQCAFCHSTVDDSFAPGIGKRLDGWPNRDLNVGAIVSLAPDLSAITTLLNVDEATVRTVLNSWGPGKYDAELLLDGKAIRPDGKSAATLIPAAFGLAGVNLHTYTGWGSVTYWNAFVATTQMHGIGTFYDPRLDAATQFPIAARAMFGHIRTEPEADLVTKKLANLHFYQLALVAPKPKDGSFDTAGSMRGKIVFESTGRCATCHVPPLFTEPGWNMHLPEEIGIDSFQSDRSPDKRYRTTPLAGLSARMKGGFYHDGRFATLQDVIEHYDNHLTLGLTDAQKLDLEEYLKSL